LPPCQLAYQTGVAHFEQGDLEAATASFIKAIRMAPEPQAGNVEYLPYIYLSASRFRLGQIREARDALVQSQVYGVAAKTQAGQLLLDRYAAAIMSAPLDDEQYVSEPQSSPVTDESFLLDDDQVELIRAKVLRRCAVSSKVAQNKLPWYFHYEFGVDLLKAGDAKRAVDAFILGANVEQDPHRGKRMYGMWFIDYLPYYQIALARSKLGEWESARAAMLTSKNLGEFTPSDPDYESFSKLDQLIINKLKQSGS